MSRAEDNDVLRRRNTLYELDDPRNEGINTDPGRRYRPRDLATEDRLRSYDNRRFDADANLVASYYDETPREERVIEFEAERFWREGGRVTSIAARYKTETGVADPDDEGFLLWFPITGIDVLAKDVNTYRVSLDKRLYDRWEIEGLIPVAPKGRAR